MVTDGIVTFTKPPVVEVVAGVALSGLPAEGSALLGAFWKDVLRSRMPHLTVQPPYLPLSEFPTPGAGANLIFGMEQGFPPPRLWASTAAQDELVQLQTGWFACNWRKVQPTDEYDRWSSRRAAFVEHFSAMCEYLAEAGLPTPIVTQCEVTYINHIVAGTRWSSHADAAKILRNPPPGSSVGLPLEQVMTEAQYALLDGGRPVGRLHLKFQPALARDGRSPIYVLELTARGAPLGSGLDGALAFLDLGRLAIDRAFLASTTDEMHDEWGLRT